MTDRREALEIAQWWAKPGNEWVNINEITAKDRLEKLSKALIAAEAEVERLKEALEALIDPNPCATDHNLFCQEHCCAYPCANREAIEALKGVVP